MNMKNDYVKQVIVVRKDLNMRKGKLAAQVAHASMKVLLDHMECQKYAENSESCYIWFMDVYESEPLSKWLKGAFTKIVVSVDSEEELFEIKVKAEEQNIMTALITDAGRTEFNGIPTNTALAVGPDWADKVDEITKDLKLL